MARRNSQKASLRLKSHSAWIETPQLPAGGESARRSPSSHDPLESRWKVIPWELLL